MVNAKTLFFIALGVFLGFITSEYRNLILLQQRDLRIAELTGDSSKNCISIEPDHTNHLINSSTNNKHLTSSVLPLVNQAGGIKISVPSSAFSWAEVNRLMALADYDRAITVLQQQLGGTVNQAQIWVTLGQIYKLQKQPAAALDAWFRVLRIEGDGQKLEATQVTIKNYLLQIKENFAVFGLDYPWLLAELDELSKYRASDAELHLAIAEIALKLNDHYQAQYHALLAMSEPSLQMRAETILTKLDAPNLIGQVSIPLTRVGKQFVVDATVDGYPVRLLLDTGAAISGLSAGFTAKYPELLKGQKPIRINTAGGSYNTFLFAVNNINIGDLVFNQHMLVQLSLANSSYFDGLLGVDILGRFEFVIDQDAAVLKLKMRKN